MSNTNHMNIKRCQCSSLLRVAGALVISSLFTLDPVFAQAYDLGNTRPAGSGDGGFTDFPSSNIGGASSGQGQSGLQTGTYKGESGGTGVGQDGHAHSIGYRSVPFTQANFPGFTPNSNPDANGTPYDKLPIQRQNVVNGMDTYSYNADNIYQIDKNNGNRLIQSGTSGSQAPQLQPGQVPVFPGQRGSLPPTSMNLQAALSPGAHTEVAQWKHANYGFPNKGGTGAFMQTYTGLRYNTPLNNANGAAGMLPPTSLGSVNLDIINNTRREKPAALDGPYTP